MLTLVAWAVEIIPTTPDQSMDYAPFFILTNHRFVIMLSIPYLFVLGIVFTCDMIALIIAIVRKNQMTTPTISSSIASRNLSLPGPLHLYTINKSVFDQTKSSICEYLSIYLLIELTIDLCRSTFVQSAQSITMGMESPVRRMNALNDLKLTIRCLSLTTWYFVSQIAIFLPGIIYFGCDMETDVRNTFKKKL